MAGTTDVNIVLGQGNAIKEVHNVKKEQLEMNQQFITQETSEKKKEEKLKVQTFDTEDKIEIKGDQQEGEDKEAKERKKKSRKDKTRKKGKLPKGSFINIRA